MSVRNPTELEPEQPQSTVSFLLVSSLSDLRFNPHRKEGLALKSLCPDVTITIRSTRPAGERSEGYDKLECKSRCRLPASPEQASFVAGLEERRYVPIPGAPVSLPVRVKGEERIDSEGNILVAMDVPFELYPKCVQDLWTKAANELLAHQERFLRLLRWSGDLDAPRSPQRSGSLYWTAGSGTEHKYAEGPQLPGGPQPLRPGFDIVWNDTNQAILESLWNDPSAQEPLAHELLREARTLASGGSLRSAVLMAATAVETGVKDHIARTRPDTDWILWNVPSPPIHKILREYLPEMHADREVISDWKLLRPLWTAAEKLFTARNDTTHQGLAVDELALTKHLETAADILYVLDALDGHAWARTRASADLRSALGWPSASEGRLRCSVQAAAWEVDDTA